MDPLRSNEYGQAPVRDDATSIDYGLQAFMRKVLNTMAMGVGVTGVVAYLVANTPALMNLIFGTPLFWVAALAPLAFVWFGFSPNAMMKKSVAQLQTRFYLFSGMFGLSLASIFMVYTGSSIARVFFITTAMFAATSMWGYTTKRDLTGMGSFLFMGLIGLIIAMVANIFIGSTMTDLAISIIGVFIFTGLIAFHTNMLKQTYHVSHGEEANAKMAVMGALQLYISFINLFMFMLRMFGNQR